MPEVEYSIAVSAPIETVWTFVGDMENWAELVTGYQRHQKISETHSVWFLKGELGGLTRVAEFNVHIVEWLPPHTVRFTLDGINEPVTGMGSFIATPATEVPPPAPPKKIGVLTRFGRWFTRYILESLSGGSKRRSTASAAAGTPRDTRITFSLTLNAGGAAGRILNLLIKPMLAPVAEDLASGIAARIEATPAGQPVGVIA